MGNIFSNIKVYEEPKKSKEDLIKDDIKSILRDMNSSITELSRLISYDIDFDRLRYTRNSVKELQETLEDDIMYIREDMQWGK